MVTVKQYRTEDKLVWDQFVKIAKNGTFLFYRDYMEYHAKRFQDCSLLLYDAKDHLIGLFPANQQGNVVFSHEGLTFGGFIVAETMVTEVMLEIFSAVNAFYKQNGIVKIVYKCIPYIYHEYPSDEDRYALFINNAQLIRRDVSTAIYMPEKYAYQQRRLRAVKKAMKQGLIFQQSNDYAAYWEVLAETLSQYHHTVPVHTVEEIQLLEQCFPNNIKLYVVQLDNRILAGTIIFENNKVAHTQYLANSNEGRLVGALDLVIYRLTTEVYRDIKYFDFGISNENQGRFLNRGLITQKEGFGARAVVHDFYEWKLK